MKGSSRAFVAHSGPMKPVRQHIVGERHDLAAAGLNIPMHVSNQMTHARGLIKIARADHQHVLVRRAHDIR